MGDYIKDIRADIGNRTLVLAGVNVFIFNTRRQLLMQHRADNGLWSCPGGIIDIDEVAEETARREVLEETGLQLGALHLVGVCSGPRMRYVYPNGDDTCNVSISYCAWVSPDAELKPDAESLELRWMALPVRGIRLGPPTAYMHERFPPETVYDRFVGQEEET